MNWLVLQARCSNYFLPSIHPSSPIEDFISSLLPPHLAVNKSAGNPLRPFFKSVGSAFWELPPAGQRVSGERMPGQTGTQRPDSVRMASRTQTSVPSSPVSVRRQSFWREVAAGVAMSAASRISYPATMGQPTLLLPCYCSCSTTTMPCTTL